MCFSTFLPPPTPPPTPSNPSTHPVRQTVAVATEGVEPKQKDLFMLKVQCKITVLPGNPTRMWLEADFDTVSEEAFPEIFESKGKARGRQVKVASIYRVSTASVIEKRTTPSSLVPPETKRLHPGQQRATENSIVCCHVSGPSCMLCAVVTC